MARRAKASQTELLTTPVVETVSPQLIARKLQTYCRNLAEVAAYGSLGETIATDVEEMASTGTLSADPQPSDFYKMLLVTALIAQRAVVDQKRGKMWLRYGALVRLMFEERGDL